jgi:enoyl-CoA hydratase
MKSQELIKFEVSDKVARITLNRPAKRNALSPELIKELHDAILEADDRVDVNVMILEGAGDDFCSGYDLAYGSDPKNQTDPEGKYRTRIGNFDDDTWTMERKMHQLLVIQDAHKPVIAKIHGRCLAGGAELALCCDIIIAADDARIGHPGTRGLGTPPINMWFYHIGPQWAKRILMTGDSILGKDAARIGLVLDSVPAERLDEEVTALAKRIALADADMLAAQKRIVNIALELSGSRTLQTIATEMDARAHLSKGPQRTKFKADAAAFGVKQAYRNRDEPYGDSIIKINSR